MSKFNTTCFDENGTDDRALRTGPATLTRINEIIVGLQTDAPLKSAIMPFGGWRAVAASLNAYGYEPDACLADLFTKCRKTHNDGVFAAMEASQSRVGNLCCNEHL